MALSIENEAGLLGLITSQTQENIELEYKRAAALGSTDVIKNEISKDVSAMANSAGGMIIYGMAENNHVPTALDGIDQNIFSKETLEQIINSRIHRKIDGVRIAPIPLSGNNSGKVAYVVSIPQSDHAPHQATDRKFYKRYNFQVLAMEEYEVRDVSRRSEAPNLSITYSLTNNTDARGDNERLESLFFDLNAVMYNSAPTPAEYSIVIIYIDHRITVLNNGRLLAGSSPTLCVVGGRSFTANRYVRKLSIPSSLPIWQGVEFAFLENPFVIRIPRSGGEYGLGWDISTPRASKKTGSVLLQNNGDVALVGAM